MGMGETWATAVATALCSSVLALPAFAQAPATQGGTTGSTGDEICSETAEVVRFRTGSAKLNAEARQTLTSIAEQMRESDQRLARVEAFTDTTGSSEVNQALSDKRARAVESFLNKKGIDTDRVETFGRGEALPTEPASDPEKRVAMVTPCARKTEAAAAPQETPSPPATAQEAPTPPPPPAPPAEPAPVAEPPVEEPREITTMPPAETDVTGGEVARRADEGVRRPFTRIGLGVSGGGGVVAFNDARSNDFADTGGSWEVRLSLGTRLPLGLELAYVGSAQGLNGVGLDEDAVMLGNGAEANLRLQWPYGMIRPFAFGGVGWTHYSVERSTVLGTNLLQNDDVGTVPLGGGITIGMPNSLMFEVRFTERLAYDDDLFRGAVTDDDEGQLDTWNVSARLGAEF